MKEFADILIIMCRINIFISSPGFLCIISNVTLKINQVNTVCARALQWKPLITSVIPR